MNSMIVVGGIGFISLLGLSCIVIDMMFPEKSNYDLTPEPKPRRYSLQELCSDDYEEVDGYINDEE